LTQRANKSGFVNILGAYITIDGLSLPPLCDGHEDSNRCSVDYEQKMPIAIVGSPRES
jgi:hypothetical protein